MFSARPQTAPHDFPRLAQTPGNDMSLDFQRQRNAIWSSYPPAAAEETARLLDAISEGSPVSQTSEAFHWVTTAGCVRTALAINARATALGIQIPLPPKSPVRVLVGFRPGISARSISISVLRAGGPTG